MLVFGNVPARWKEVEGSTGSAAQTDIDEAGDRRLQQAQQTFRDLGSQMVAFAEVEWPATYVVRLLGFDAVKVGRALFGLSNNIATSGQGRADSLQTVETLLKLKSTDQ